MRALGVKIETNVVVGQSVTIDELIEEEGYEAVFIGSGADFPDLWVYLVRMPMVFSANEYLTRSNLMKAFDEAYDTRFYREKGCCSRWSNVAMDAARTALRLGAEGHIVYRRGKRNYLLGLKRFIMPKEGIHFKLLSNPKEIW